MVIVTHFRMAALYDVDLIVPTASLWTSSAVYRKALGATGGVLRLPVFVFAGDARLGP